MNLQPLDVLERKEGLERNHKDEPRKGHRRQLKVSHGQIWNNWRKKIRRH